MDQWTVSESEKTGLHGSIYHFVVDYEQIVGVTTIYDMHRYLMIKHNISSVKWGHLAQMGSSFSKFLTT